MKRVLGRMVAGLVGALVLLYAGDWAVWRTRVAMGGGMGTVQVGVLIETPLKGEKEEYDWAGDQVVDCSRSLFPQAGSGACWWLQRKQTLVEE